MSLHNVQGCLGVSPNNEREEHDYYATEPAAAEWLLKLVDLAPDIWECACGEGHLSKVFENAGKNVLSTDLIDRGYGYGGVDFLILRDTSYHGDIVTNPPYKHAEEFIYKALDIVDEGRLVCMFLKVQFLEGQKRRKLFAKYPPKYVYVSSARLRCGKNGVFSDSMVAYAWYVWEKGYNGETVLRWFN